jgi:choline dehydrogenase-like flavoprotein
MANFGKIASVQQAVEAVGISRNVPEQTRHNLASIRNQSASNIPFSAFRYMVVFPWPGIGLATVRSADSHSTYGAHRSASKGPKSGSRGVITDLSLQQNIHRTVGADILIVGAGVAGLTLANCLRRNGIRVVILESGGGEQLSETHPLNRVIQLGDAYGGAAAGRFRCLGGTSTRWGGALIPFLPSDLMERPYLNLPSFPVGMDDVHPYLSQVERDFGIDEGSYEEGFVEQFGASKHIPTGDPDFRVRFAKWPPFKKRNVATLFRDVVQRDPDLEISLNSTATDFKIDRESGRLMSVTARHGERSISVKAKRFVICAGAIETTRLLLLINRQHDDRIFMDCQALGHYFYDHLSINTALIRAHDINRLNRLAGFRFVGSTMRSLRFELSPSAQANEGVGSAFGHISFRTERATGFDVLRQLLRSRQRGVSFRPALLADALRDLPYFAKLAFWRSAHNQLLWPTPAHYEFHIVVEQLPRFNNYIALASEKDVFGLPLAAINWRVAPEDCITFDVFRRLFESYWERQGLRRVGDLVWTHDPLSKTISEADVYHPGGSTRMGADRRNSVVDSDLSVFGIPNLWTASTAAFPSGGGANPTLTLMLFTLRLADHLVRAA